jgi:hypothetical protein
MSGVFHFTPVDEALLAALGRYRFLSIEQAERLGIGRRWNLGDRLRALTRAGFVDMLPSSPFTGPRVHWLTRRGSQEARTAGILPPDFPDMPARGYRGGAHVRQRVAIVDCHMALRAWAEAQGHAVDWFKAEFERNAGSLEPATRVSWEGVNYTPDGLGRVTAATGKSWLFSLEMETGGQAHSLDNFRGHLGERLAVVENFVMEQALDWPDEHGAARLLFVFADADMLERAKKNLPRPQADIWASVYFTALPRLVEDFAGEWWQVGGRIASPFSV